MISICLPTRGRPESFKKMYISALQNAVEPDEIQFVVYRDNDDESIYEYPKNHKEVRGERIIQSQMYNECQKVATGPIYMFAADDIVFCTKDWDKRVAETFEKYPDKILFVFPNDKRYRSRFGSTGFMHKNWVDALGYFLPPYFAAQYADNWVNCISGGVNRKIYLGDVIIVHCVITDDKTHAEYWRRGQELQSKRVYYFSKKEERERSITILQKFIDNFKS